MSNSPAPVQTAPVQTAHTTLLNRLHEMQQAPYYATARPALAQAESLIIQLEQELATLRRKEIVPSWDSSGLPTNLAGAAADAGDWLNLIDRLVCTGVWKFSSNRSRAQLRGARFALATFLPPVPIAQQSSPNQPTTEGTTP